MEKSVPGWGCALGEPYRGDPSPSSRTSQLSQSRRVHNDRRSQTEGSKRCLALMIRHQEDAPMIRETLKQIPWAGKCEKARVGEAGNGTSHTLHEL